MKKVLFLMVLAVGCFAQLYFIEDKPDSRFGYFFGGDLGIGANAMSFASVRGFSIYEKNPSFASFVASAKVGGVNYFSKRYGLRYYYNMDGNLLFGEEKGFYDTKIIGPIPGLNYVVPPYNQFYIFSTSHTLNVDAIFNLFADKNFELALIGGMGIGVVVGKYGLRYETMLAGYANNFVDFEFRLNLGTRIMFDQKYGIELMAKLPVTPATLVFGDPSNPKNGIKTHPYYFSLGFVIERF